MSNENAGQPSDSNGGEVVVGNWWRFDQYELKEGMITPSSGGRCERYDPWSLYEYGDGGFLKSAPYQDLMNLLESLKIRPHRGGGFEVALGDEARLLAWCSKYGLLGLLPHNTISATLSPRWRNPLIGTVTPPSVFPRSIHLLRTNTGWIRKEKDMPELWPDWNEKAEQEGKPVMVDSTVATMRPRVLYQTLDSYEIMEASLTEAWSRYFPSIPPDEHETFSYPTPLTDHFWELYSEPITEFIEAALQLRDAMEGLRAWKAVVKPTDNDWRTVLEARNLIHLLVRSVEPAAILGKAGQLDQRWASKSLLSSLAVMVLQDLVGTLIDRCENCGKWFTSKSPVAKYCSSKCRLTAQKRTYRQRVASRK